MKKYVLYGHDGSANHGCEALVRTTAELLDKKYSEVVLVSANPQEDYSYGLDEICDIRSREDKTDTVKKNLDFCKAYYSLKVKHDYFPMDALAEIQALGASKNDIALAIGGDSYCYSDSMRKRLFHQHRVFRTIKMKTVLWGCSFEADLLEDPEIANDIRSFDLITARESISYEALKKVNPNTIQVCDSAFILKETRLPLPEGFEGESIVGINTSPLIERREAKPGIARKNFEKLIESILKETTYKVLLVPHVVWRNNDDRSVLLELFEKYRETGRIAMVEDCTCSELKGYISRCRFFIGARTHATIAAYSTGVPTLVLGYSTKSKGIAKDLFGSYDNFVLSVQCLENEMTLTEHWRWIHEHESDCRAKLEVMLPEYIKRVYNGREAVCSL